MALQPYQKIANFAQGSGRGGSSRDQRELIEAGRRGYLTGNSEQLNDSITVDFLKSKSFETPGGLGGVATSFS